MILAALVVVAGAALLRGPSARLFGGADSAGRVATGVGQRRTIRLDDGSRVDLGVVTTVTHPREFAADRRVIALTGEALFTIAEDSLRPFVVSAGHVRVEANAGSFAVRAYGGQAAARVVVIEGTVRIRPSVAANGPARQVSAGQLARIMPDGAIWRQDSVDVERLTAWRSGRIIFAGTPLREALVELERWQDVDLRIADSVVANRRVTGEFTTLQTFTEILDEIALGIGAVYTWQGGVVTFRRER